MNNKKVNRILRFDVTTILKFTRFLYLSNHWLPSSGNKFFDLVIFCPPDDNNNIFYLVQRQIQNMV